MQDALVSALGLATLAGPAMPLGAYLARTEPVLQATLRGELVHGVIAFGGGALVSAVALDLVLERAG